MTSTALGLKAFFGKILTAGNCEVVHSGVDGAASPTPDDVDDTALELALCVVDHYTGGLASLNRPGHKVPGCSKTLLRTVDYMSERHQILFSSIVNRLKTNGDNFGPTFNNVVNEMFSDNQYNWGRVVTVYAFAGWLARYVCIGKESDTAADRKSAEFTDPKCALEIAKLAGDFVAERLGGWIRKQGGWDVMDQFFKQRDDPESSIWNGLLYTFVGLGALATMAAVR